ncbi:MAG: DUF1848 family protein [Pseudomonadales bacterium]|nr:DUF1848 family protein [Pseudomonadales bacterium]
MFSAIYIEEEVRCEDRVQEILARFSEIPQIECERYGEIFNRNAQNFRLQKKSPALILAKKYGNLVLTSPEGYGFQGGQSFYFSHMLNCIYDCRYCFLQGMYRSANYVLFVNYEDFAAQLESVSTDSDQSAIFYSGYDCDSLALEPISKFCEYFLPVFKRTPNSILEIRTKSTQIRSILETESFENCVIAMSFTAHGASQQFEHKVPSIAKRIEALLKLQQAGWRIALRFEPIIWESQLIKNYQKLFDEIFATLDIEKIHSVSIGEFRMPSSFYKNIVKLYPDEALFARETEISDGMISLATKEVEPLQELEQLLLGYISAEQYYRCA